MAENYTKMCRICLKNYREDNISDSSCYTKFFIHVLSLNDFNEKLLLCIWCKAALRRAMAVFTLALESQKTLHKLSADIPINPKSLYSLNYVHHSHIDIPPHIIECPDYKTENMTIEMEELTNPLLVLQDDEIPLKINKKKTLESTDITNEESISNFEQELIEKEIAIKKRNRKQFDFNELNFEVKYLNFEEQLKEVELKKLKYKEFQFQCDECGVGFVTNDLFEEHNVRHSELSGQHKCKICSLHFKSQDVLSQHTLAHKRRFKCLICSIKFTRQSLCVAHRYKCGGVVQPIACAECSKIFSNEYSLKVHMKVHKAERKYCCDQCDKTFGSKQRLTVHLRSHSGIKPFSCSQCARGFTTQSNLRAHSAVHEHTTQFYCVECHRYYKTAKSLKRHFNESAKHVELKSDTYSCKECFKQFSTEKSLNYHISTRHGTEHRCTQCDKGMNTRLAFAIISSACWSAFQHGYNTGVLNAPQAIISEWLQKEALTGTNTSLTAVDDPKVTTVMSIAVAIYCVGGMLGGIITGVVADRFGRKGGLLWNNVLVFVAALLEGLAKVANSAEMLILGRLIIGVNSGLNAGLAPMYLAEISPVSLRGSIGTVYQLVITMTILLSQVLGLESVLGTPEGWPYLLAATAIPAVLQICTLPVCPESPKFLLLNKGQELHAQRALNWLRGDVAVHGEMEEMHQEAEKNKISKKVTLRELFSNRQLRQPLFIAMVVMVAQQFSGINAVIFFSTDIFRKVHLTSSQSQYATLGMGAMNVVMTVVSLLLVEVAGRKTLLLSGFAGMFTCTVGLVVAFNYVYISWVSYLCIALVILFVVMFAVGPGSIPWFLVTELFNQSSRPAASSVAVTVNWTANFIVGLSFLQLSMALGTNVFIIFAVLQLIFIFFIFFKVPETKNKTVEEITAMFRQQM